MRVSREIEFKAVHSHHGMMTEPQHGHNYRVVICMEGEPNEEGFVCDFRAVKRIFKNVVLDGVEETSLDLIFEYPTAEVIASWIWHKLTPFFPLYSVEVKEKTNSWAIYYGPGVQYS